MNCLTFPERRMLLNLQNGTWITLNGFHYLADEDILISVSLTSLRHFASFDAVAASLSATQIEAPHHRIVPPFHIRTIIVISIYIQ